MDAQRILGAQAQRTLSIKQEDESIKIEETAAEENGKERKIERVQYQWQGMQPQGRRAAMKISAYYNADVLVVIDSARRTTSPPQAVKTPRTALDDHRGHQLARPGQKDTLAYKKQAAH